MLDPHQIFGQTGAGVRGLGEVVGGVEVTRHSLGSLNGVHF